MLRLLVLFVALVGLSRPAAAGPRVAVVLDAGSSANEDGPLAQTVFSEALLQAGYALVDAETAARLRAVSVGALFGDRPPAGVITGLDAELIVALQVDTEAVQIDMLGPAHSRVARLSVRVLRTDTATISAQFTARAQRHGYTRSQATENALRAATTDAVSRLSARPLERPRSIDVQISGLRDIADWSALRRTLEALPGVERVRPRLVDPRLTTVEVDFAGSAEALAESLQSSAGLAVVRLDGQTLVTRVDRGRTRTVQVIPTRFGGPAGAEASRAVAIALSKARGLQLSAGLEPLPWPDDPLRWQSAVERLALPADQPILVLRGRTRRIGGALSVQAELWQLASTRMQLAEQASCGDGDLVGCAETIATGLSTRLANQRLAAPPATLSMRISHLDDLFPHRANAYAAGHPLGRLTVRNAGPQPATLGPPCLRLGDGPPTCAEAPPVTLAAGEEAELSLRARLPEAWKQNGTVRDVDVQLELPVERAGEARAPLAAHARVRLHRQGAMDWSHPAAVAAFVDPYHPPIARLARQVVTAARAETAWARSAAIFEALRAAGVRYVPDAVAVFGDRPVDDLSAPSATLRARGGDCDDLAILFAALVGSVGVDAMLIVQPRHVLVAIDAGVPPGSATLVSLDDGAGIVHDGTIWLPIETTALDGDFVDAWRAGSTRAIGGARIVLREAWQRWPPAANGSGDEPAGLAPPDDVTGALRARLAALAEARLTTLGANEPGLRVRHLVALGRADEARQLLRAVLDASPGSVAALNNRGNLLLLDGAVPEATASYTAALTGAETSDETRFNLALAAHLSGDGPTFDAQVFALLDARRQDLIDALGRAARGASGRTGDRRPGPGDLCTRLGLALSARGAASPCSAARVAEGSPAALSTFVRWL